MCEFVKKELAREQMELLISDYAFNRLSKNENALFEYNLHKFPEISKEIDEIKKVFSKSSIENYHDYMEKKSKNLNFMVNNKVYEKQNNRIKFKNFRFMLPVLAVIVIFIIARNMQVPNNQDSQFNFPIDIVTEKDILLLDFDYADFSDLNLTLISIDNNPNNYNFQVLKDFSEVDFINLLKEIENDEIID